MASTPKVTIIGTGALGCLFAARLSRVAEVGVFGSWAEGLEAIGRDGIEVRAGRGLIRERVAIEGQPGGSGLSNLVLVLVKAWQTRAVAPIVARFLSPRGVVLTLQNGVGNLETLEEACGRGRVIAGATGVGATLLAPGVVRHAGGDEVILPEGDAGRRAAESLLAAGFEVRFATGTDGLLWGKLVVSAALNPVGALFGKTNGELVEHTEARSLMERSAREVAAVAAARGIALPFSDPVARVLEVAERTARNRCSMLQDLAAGRPTEIDAICGAVIRAAEAASVPVPVNRELWQSVSEISSRPAAAAVMATSSGAPAGAVA